MLISFSVEIEAGKLLPESELAQDQRELREHFTHARDIDGEVIFPVERKGEPLRFHDMLTFFIPQLCFGSITDLVDGRPFVAEFASAPTLITLTPDKDTVIFSCSVFKETFSFPRTDFLSALFDCGERFLAVWGNLCDDPDTQELLRFHNATADKAREALKKLG